MVHHVNPFPRASLEGSFLGSSSYPALKYYVFKLVNMVAAFEKKNRLNKSFSIILLHDYQSIHIMHCHHPVPLAQSLTIVHIVTQPFPEAEPIELQASSLPLQQQLSQHSLHSTHRSEVAVSYLEQETPWM